VVLLPGTTSAELASVADRIRTAIARLEVPVPVIRPGKPEVISGLTASIGAAVYPETATEYTILLQAADDAVFEAKAGGRDRVVLATARTELTRPEIPDAL
jgi:diguanylate cyclase (GGDEF)-like protein